MIEDEHRIASALKKGLEQERFAVDVAHDGYEGFDLASTEDYDLIILDLMLPGMDGLEICKKLRQEGRHVPILILTAKGQTTDKIAGLEGGADDYLTKPFSFEELLARVRALVRRPRVSLPDILTVGDLQLDTRNYEAKRDGKKIVLTAKEFSLLEYLMRQAGRIVSKEQIIAHVWDYDADILPNTVEVYIKNLRRKIESPFAQKRPLIKTIKGFGYKIG